MPSFPVPTPEIPGPTVGPCSAWASLDDVCCDVERLGEANLERFLIGASEVMWALSGRQFGLCTVTLRPQRGAATCPSWGERWARYEYGWSLPLILPSSPVERPRIRVNERLLPRPVHSIDEVKIDGTVLDASEYRLDGNRILVRLNGDAWPTYDNDPRLPDTDPETWSITLQRGRPIPAMGVVATASLACELAKACSGDPRCRLPARVTQLVRKDVQMQMIDPMEFLDKGRTGINDVDLFLMTVNPAGLRRRGRVHNPSSVLARYRRV